MVIAILIVVIFGLSITIGTLLLHIVPDNLNSLRTIDSNTHPVPFINPQERVTAYTYDTLPVSSHHCIHVPQDLGCARTVNFRSQYGIYYPRISCRFENIYFQKDRFYYLSDNQSVAPFFLTLGGDDRWKPVRSYFPIEVPLEVIHNRSSILSRPKYIINRVGTMVAQTVDHFGNNMIDVMVPVAVVLALHYPLTAFVNQPMDLIVNERPLMYPEVSEPVTLNGPGYFIANSHGIHNSQSLPYCSTNSEDICLVRSFAAGMGGFCESYQSVLTPYFTEGHRLLSYRTQMLLNTSTLEFQTMTPRLLIMNKKNNRAITNVPELLEEITKSIDPPINITVVCMQDLSVKEQMFLYQTHSIVFGICGSAIHNGATSFIQRGSGLIIGAREDGNFCNIFSRFPSFQPIYNFRYIHTQTKGWEAPGESIYVPPATLINAIKEIIAKHKSSNPYPQPPFPTWHMDENTEGVYEVLPDSNHTRIKHMNFRDIGHHQAWVMGTETGNMPPIDDPERCPFPW